MALPMLDITPSLDIASPVRSGTPRANAGASISAEAACYAVLRRLAPALRHDMAGAMQPLGMIAMVLQRRLQMPVPDLQAIAKNVAAISTLAKEASAGCMNAIGWLAPHEALSVGLQAGVEEVIKLLALELSECGLVPVVEMAAGSTLAPQIFFRTVVAGAVFALCDQRGQAGTLQISCEGSDGHHAEVLMLRVVADPAAGVSTQPLNPRCISWQDVEAMAATFDLAVARGEGWITLAVPTEAVL